MKYRRADWLRIRREALLALFALLAGGALVAASYGLRRDAARSLAAAEEKLQGARQALARIDGERAELTAGLAPYRELVGRSIIGREERLQWHETLEAERTRNAIEKLSYTLSPRQPLPGPDPAAGVLRPYRSSMALDLAFQRETDLVAFLESIAENTHALPLLRKCEMFRSPEAGGAKPDLLAAQCQIDWVTLERPAAGAGAPAP